MANVNDIMALENGELDELEAAKVMQALINSGEVWHFQGSYGRSAMGALESGRNMLGPKSCSDAYGNFVPSRKLVKAGSKGSRELVVENFGEDYAKALEEVE